MYSKKRILSLVVTLIIIISLSTFVKADIISSDNFECGTFSCGSGWIGSWSYTGTCEITSLGGARGAYHMRGESNCLATRNFNAATYQKINMTFYATAQSLESEDYCHYYYFNGTDSILLLTLADGDDDMTHDYYEFDVTRYGISSNSGIVMQAPSSVADYCAIDDIVIYGENEDTMPPYFTDNTPQNQTIIYNQPLSYDINASDDVAIDCFSVNDTKFKIDCDGLLENSTVLAANLYWLNITINDTANNKNSTIIYINVTKASNILTLSSSSGWNYFYGTSTTLSCSSLYETPNLYKNNLEIPNPLDIVFEAGVHLIKCNISETENYSSNSIEQFLTIAKANPSQNMQITGTSPIIYPTFSDFFATETNEGDADCIYSMDKINAVYGVGIWTFNFSTSGCANYTEGSVTKDLTVIQNNTYVLSITGTSPILYGSSTDVQGTNCPSELTCTLDKENKIYSAGIVTFNYSTEGNQNYSANSITIDITILKADSLVFTYLNNSRDNITIQQGTSIWLNSSKQVGDEGSEIELYINKILYTSGPSDFGVFYEFSEVGLWNITTLYKETQNYTESYETWFVNVTQDPPPLISFVPPVTLSGLYSQTWISANVTADDTNLQKITINLYNSTQLIESVSSQESSLFMNFTSLKEGIYYLNASANDSLGNINTTETLTIVLDITPPTWTIEPENQILFENESLLYQIEASDSNGIDFYFIDNSNFEINQSGFIKNISALSSNTYLLNISVNDTANNILSKTISIEVLPLPNLSPTIHSNQTLVDGIPKIPEFNDNFILKVNASDPENNPLTLIFSLYSPNGSIIFNNFFCEYAISDNFFIFQSPNYTINDFGIWNWSYTISDSHNNISVNGSFEVYSDLIIFPSEYYVAPDPKNQTLILNLSLYHLSREIYFLNFSYSLNATYFNLTMDYITANFSFNTVNSSFPFINPIRILINESVPEELFEGNITIIRHDNKSFVVPIKIGINPPSGNIDAFDLSNNRCSSSNCDIDIVMENDETRTFSWLLKNTGNYTLTNCVPNLTGFYLFNLGVFSQNLFNLSIGESTKLDFIVSRPSINSYYGKLEVICAGTSNNYLVSLGSEPDNMPSIKIIVIADSGVPYIPPSGGGSGKISTITLIKKPEQLTQNLTRILNITLNYPLLMAIKRGTSKTINIEIINQESSYLNNCSIILQNPLSQWSSLKFNRGVSAGERIILPISIKVPEDSKIGIFSSFLRIQCDEGYQTSNIVISIFRNSFESQINNYERSVDIFRAFLSLEEFANQDHQITIDYELVDSDGIIVSKGQRLTSLQKNEKKDYTLEFKIPKEASGEYQLRLMLSDSLSSFETSKNILLYSKSIMGLAISDTNLKALSRFGILLISIITAFFIGKFAYSKIKKTSKINIPIEETHMGKQLIKLNLKNYEED